MLKQNSVLENNFCPPTNSGYIYQNEILLGKNDFFDFEFHQAIFLHMFYLRYHFYNLLITSGNFTHGRTRYWTLTWVKIQPFILEITLAYFLCFDPGMFGK